MRAQAVSFLRQPETPLTPTEKERKTKMKQYTTPVTIPVCLADADILTISTHSQANDSIVDKLDYANIQF